MTEMMMVKSFLVVVMTEQVRGLNSWIVLKMKYWKWQFYSLALKIWGYLSSTAGSGHEGEIEEDLGMTLDEGEEAEDFSGKDEPENEGDEAFAV